MVRIRFRGGPLRTTQKAERAAREFATMIGGVVNATISHAPVTLTEVTDEMWVVAHAGANKLPAPLPLTNGHFFFLYNLLGLRRNERYLTTLEYRYTYQATESDDSWIFRYEYVREPPAPYPYAREHLHVNAQPAFYNGASPFPGLHLPTGRRVTVERVARHLIAEHGIEPLSPDWERTLKQAEDHFRTIQEKRVMEGDAY